MTDWLKTFLPRKYAVIDGRRVTEPIINKSDTTFAVTGDSNWGSTSKYNVYLQGPNSYYLYKTLSEPKDDPSAGGARQEQITVTRNEPERLNRYRGYLNSLAPEDYKYWWQQIFSKADGGKVEKGDKGISDGIEKREFSPTWNQGEIRQGFQKARPKWLLTVQDTAEDLNNNPQKYGPLSWLFGNTAKYLTGQGGYEDMAAILPGISAANTAGKAAVGKSTNYAHLSLPRNVIRRNITQGNKAVLNYRLVDKPGITNELAWDIIEGGLGNGNEGFSHIIETGVSTKPYLNNAWNGSWDNIVRLIEGNKHGGRLMRQGGKIIEIPFENK